MNRISPNGKVISSSGRKLAKISDGHNILFNLPSSWDSTFEHVFDAPDGKMSQLVEWVSSIVKNHKKLEKDGNSKISHECQIDQFNDVIECMLSLVVRFPKYRSSIAQLVEHYRGAIAKKEKKMLISSNIHQKYKNILESAKGRGKLAILFSDENEFIFGDGFYNNFAAATESATGAKILIPITPLITLVWVYPREYMTLPRLVSQRADTDLIQFLNYTIQVYSNEYLFYRNEKPKLIDDFKQNKHLVYSSYPDPIDSLIANLIHDLNLKN